MDRDTAQPTIVDLPGKHARDWVSYQETVGAPSTHIYPFVWNSMTDAIGPFCTDVDGNIFLDFTSHIASAPLGYNHPALLDRLEEFDLVDPLKIAGQDFYVGTNEPPSNPQFPGPAQLMHRLTEITEHYGMDTVFLSNSGAEAIENAIKICYDYRDGAKYGITFNGAFHGRTLGALSLNRSKAIHRRNFPELPGIQSHPFCTDRNCTQETCECGFFTRDGRSQLSRSLDPQSGSINPNDIAYIILEPIQGEGGIRVPSEAFMHELQRICTENEIPIIADEIQSGLGRTGTWWGADLYDLEPDVISAAKGLRVGATISRSEVFPAEKGRLSSTWGAGDILSSFVGVLSIDIIETHELRSNAKDRGIQFLERLREPTIDHVVDVRGRGMMIAIEFDTKPRRDAMLDYCMKHRGLLTLPSGYKSLRLLPPLTVTEREIDLAADILIESMTAEEVRNQQSAVHPDDVL